MRSSAEAKARPGSRQWTRIGDMRFQRVITVIAAILLALASLAQAQVTVRAAVDQQEVFVGETFTFQIQVEGSDAADEPNTAALAADFTVEPRGGQQNSSESVTIVNGRMSRVSQRGYVFNFGLTPKREGRLLIPTLTVTVDRQSYQTQAIPILVKKPMETEEFKLRLTLDKAKAYVGEPVTLTVTWYIGRDVNGFNFNLPILTDPRFTLSETAEAVANPSADRVVRIPAGGGEILAEKGNGVLDGNNYLTVSFSRRLIAKEAGLLTLPQATVSCQALGVTRQRGRDPFNGMFPDDFFGRSRQSYQTVVVPSNEPTLEVMPLPEEGRPADFTGLVGAYSLAVSAAPTEVKVGDPITLTIQVAGPAVAGVTLPALESQLGVNDFKVPAEMAPGEGKGVLKTFTQTIRARHAGVKEVPTLHLSYFNPHSGRYETASSRAVPLAVAEARMVTAQDAEGTDAASPAKKELKAANGGINFNYEGPEVLASQTPIGAVRLDAVWISLLLLPPGLFLLLLLWTLMARHGQKDPAGRAARQASRGFAAALSAINPNVELAAGYQALGHALREYLGAKLRRNPAALTYVDVEPLLLKGGANVEVMTRLRQVMEGCAAYEYAGPASGVQDLTRLLELARQVVAELEKSGIDFKRVSDRGGDHE